MKAPHGCSRLSPPPEPTLFDVPARPKPDGLYGGLPGHQAQSPTSRRAAVRVAPRFGSRLDRILALITNAGAVGYTSDEVAAALGEPNGYKTGAAITTLKRRGDVVPSGRTRKTRSGQDADVVVAAAFASP